jgi:hypothetical protein
MPKERAPVFVVGCPRSGTTLLYDILLSSGNFAVYLAESNVFNLLAPRFGDLSKRANREKLINAWLESKLFRASFLDARQIRDKIINECETTGDFLRIVMDEIARQQGVERWADNSPEELLHMVAIKKALPDALFLHIIRDGRDVSLSLEARPHKWIKPFPWDRQDTLFLAGIYWEWMVRRGQQQARNLAEDYLEVRFEDLKTQPAATLAQIGRFIRHDLNHERIMRVGMGSVTAPNTSFKGDSGSPVGRWLKKMDPEKLSGEQIDNTVMGTDPLARTTDILTP